MLRQLVPPHFPFCPQTVNQRLLGRQLRNKLDFLVLEDLYLDALLLVVFD